MAQISIIQSGPITPVPPQDTTNTSAQIKSLGLGTSANTNGNYLSINNSSTPTTFAGGVVVYSSSGVFSVKQADGSIVGGFTAGGDLSGSATSQTVAKLNGTTLDVSTLTDGYVLTYDLSSTSFKLRSTAGGGFVAAGDLTGTSTTQTVSKLAGTTLDVTSLTDGYVLTYDSGTTSIKLRPSSGGSFTAGGDLTGSSSSQTVSNLQGTTLNISSLTDGYVLTYDLGTTTLKLKPPTGGGGSFTAGGDLSGTSYSQTVNSISGSSPIAISPAVLQFTTATTAPTLKQADNTTASATAQALTVQSQNATGTAATGGDLTLASGTGTLLDGYINLQSGSNIIAKIVPNKLVSLLGRRTNVTTITGTYQVVASDDIIVVTTNASAFTITLPTSPIKGDIYNIKDGVGNATLTPISVDGNGHNIDGAAGILLNISYGSFIVVFNGTEWNTL